MIGPDGTEYPVEGVFIEIVPKERIVSTDEFGKDFEPAEWSRSTGRDVRDIHVRRSSRWHKANARHFASLRLKRRRSTRTWAWSAAGTLRSIAWMICWERTDFTAVSFATPENSRSRLIRSLAPLRNPEVLADLVGAGLDSQIRLTRSTSPSVESGLFTMHGPDGKDYENRSVFDVIEPGKAHRPAPCRAAVVHVDDDVSPRRIVGARWSPG